MATPFETQLLNALTALTNRQNDGFIAFKPQLKPIPVLEDELEWSKWVIEIKDALKLMRYGDMITDANALPDKQDLAKTFICQSLNRTDKHIVHESTNVKEALESLRRAHAPEDHNLAMKLYRQLYGLKVGTKETPTALINRAQDIATQLKDVGKEVDESVVSSAVVDALDKSPMYGPTIKTMLTVGGEITLNKLLNTFQNTSTPAIPGAFNAEGVNDDDLPPLVDPLTDQIANLTKVANQIRKQVYKNDRFTPYKRGGRHDGNGGRGRGDNQRGGYQGNGGHRGRGGPQHGNRGGYRGGYNGQPQGRGGRGFDARGGGRGGNRGRGEKKCYNCGYTNHLTYDCYHPCGGCGSHDHQFRDCPRNPVSNNYRGIPRNGPARANYAGSPIDATTIGDNIPQANFAQAFNSFHPFPEDLWNGPPGFDPNYNHGPADPTAYLETVGVCASASVFDKKIAASSDWIMDGGASHHFTPHRAMLHSYIPDDPSNPVYVRVAINQWTRRVGVGSIRVLTNVEGRNYYKEIKDVWHVPAFTHSLLSQNMLKAQGCWGILGKNGDMNDYYFDRNNKLWLITRYYRGLNRPDWKLELPIIPKTSANPSPVTTKKPTTQPTALYANPNHATDKESPALWHQRLGHCDMRALTQLVQSKKVTGIKVAPSALRKHCTLPACKICVMAKHNRSPFHRKLERPSEILHTVHSDVCGPYPVPSLGGGAYVVTLVDDYSGKADVSIVKSKDVVADELRRMILELENSTGKKVKFLFSDRGGEYIGHVLASWCASKGIKHNFSVPRTPEQNGVAERLNQTLNNIVRALLFQYKLYLPLWGHAMIYACMLYNVRLHKTLQITHHEAFYGKVPDLSNFRTFGCLVYARVADSARKKLDPKSQQGIFLGPEVNGPGYKVLTYNEKLKEINTKCAYSVTL
jgi:transposase InsO family protein